MTDDLVKRLRELHRFAAEQKSRDWDEQDEIRHLFHLVFNVGWEAADRIQSLEVGFQVADEKWSKISARCEALEAALREIGVMNALRDRWSDPIENVIRVALAGEKKDE